MRHSLVAAAAAAALVLFVAAAAHSVHAQAAAAAPEQVHLAFAGTGSTSYTVSWYTTAATATSTVQYGTQPGGPYNWHDQGEQLTYFPGSYVHHVTLTQLVYPDTRYYYVVGDASGGWSSEFDFTSPPPPANTSGQYDDLPWSVAAFGDMGISNSNATIAALLTYRDSVDFAYHIGDFSYADDRFLEPNQYEAIWNDWANAVQPLSAHMAYMTLPGNHEASCRSIGSALCDARHDNFTSYRYRFRMPFHESGAVNSMWFSFDYKNVHFVSISTETDFPSAPEGPDTLWNGGPFGDQLAWLQNDLNTANLPANRALRPWLIVLGHRPLYTTSKSDFPPFAVENLRSNIETLLNQARVDLYMSGHVHAYERNYAVCTGGSVVKTYVNPPCPVYVVNGAAGNTEGHSGFVAPQPFTAYRNNANYGFGVLTVVNSTSLQWSFVRADTNAVDDTFTLVKDHTATTTTTAGDDEDVSAFADAHHHHRRGL